MDIKEYNVETYHKKQNHPWEYARFEVVLDIIKSVLKKDKDDILTILDIGCGDAFFLEQLSKHFNKSSFHAIDTAFTDESIALFEKRYELTGIKFHKDISEIDTTVNEVDIILLLDVIEHIENDIDFLSSLKSIHGFNSQTLVITTVPAYQSLFCSHDTWLGHYRRYSRVELEHNIRQAGFISIKSGYFFTSLLLPRFFKKNKEKILKTKNIEVTGIGDYNGSKFMSSLIKNILIMDYKISKFIGRIGIKLSGLSCYSVCMKHKQ